MGSFTEYLERSLLNEVFGGIAFTAPTVLYIGLSTASISNIGGNINEPPAGSAYQRIAVANNQTNWPPSTSGGPAVKTNGIVVTFPQATGAWGIIVDFFIADAAVGGNILAYGTLTTSKSINTGDTAQFGIGDLIITLQ